MNGEISLYIHVPFCTKKCPYCHFFVLPDSQEGKKSFLDSLQLEWDLKAPSIAGKQIVSIYFGGGTPSLLSPEAIEAILRRIFQSNALISPSCEITLEANPERIDKTLIENFKQAGINRISLGVQSLDDSLLLKLGRAHKSKETKKAIESVYEAGILNISIDLMYEVPGQTLLVWEQSMKEATKLPISHLSLYNLVFEPGTLFYKKRDLLTKDLPSEEEALAMLNFAVQHMQQEGFSRYEISAFTRDGKHSIHNSGYWIARPFLGLGPSAFSYVEGRRFQNTPHLKKWGDALRQGLSFESFSEKLPLEAKQKELLAVELRLLQGVNLSLFEKNNGPISPSLAQSIQALLTEGLLEQKDTQLLLSKEGLNFYDTVASELL